MTAVRNGDIEQLGVLFERYKKLLFNFFLLQTSNRHASEDLVQDVFFRILKYRKTYRDDGSFKTWMFTIARNARNDYYREHCVKHEPLENHLDIIGHGPGPDENCERGDEISLLKTAIDRLSADKREVLLLSRYQNMKYKDIGNVLGCSAGAVKVRVHRAMHALTDIYHELTGGNSL